MSSRDYIQSQRCGISYHSSHYNPMKGRLQEEKKIFIRPLGLDSVL